MPTPAAATNRLIFIAGLGLLLPGLVIIFFTFFPVLKAETVYQVSRFQPAPGATPTPVNPDFNLYIPRLKANTPVVKNVDPANSAAYQLALSKGIAHAKGSALPNQRGNVFIFAHSAGNWYQANRYNAIFYLLNKLVAGDQIILTYLGHPRTFAVTASKIVSASDTSYLKPTATDQLTLMTCWPPGTTLKRLILLARPLD
jgi:sortase A